MGADPLEDKPGPKATHNKPAHIGWEPRVLNSTQPLEPGQSFTMTASFTSNQTIADVRLIVWPKWRARVHVSPNHFDTVTAGQEYSVSVAITAPTRIRRAGFTALVQLRQGRRTLANPLLVLWRPGGYSMP